MDQNALVNRLEAAQKILKDDLKMDQKSLEKRLDNQIIRLSAILTVVCGLVAVAGQFGFKFTQEVGSVVKGPHDVVSDVKVPHK